MARPKKAVAKVTEPKEKKVIITKEQIETLRKISSLIGDARRTVDNIEEADTLVSAGFKAGKAYDMTDKAEDLVDALINELDPIDYTEYDDSDDDSDY